MVKEVGEVQDPPSFALKLEKPRSAGAKTAGGSGPAPPKPPMRQAAATPSAAKQAELPATEPLQPADHGAKAPTALPGSEMQTQRAQPLQRRPQAPLDTAEKGKVPAKADATAAKAPAPVAPKQVLLGLGISVHQGLPL